MNNKTYVIPECFNRGSMDSRLKHAGMTLLLCALIGFSQLSLAEGELWKELKGDHFIIYYLGDENFAKEVSRKAEFYYHQISDDLGYARHSIFWQWEKRVKIYIYPTQEAFLKATGHQQWSQGVADYKAKEIRSYAGREEFLEILLPHEITHLIFRDYVGFKGEVPLWLDEGVAQWEEPGKRVVARKLVRAVFEDGKGFSLRSLMETDIRNVEIELAVQMFYAQAVSLVDFLVQEKGADNFVILCRQLRDGKSLEEALRFTYPTEIRNLNELEEQWKKYIFKSS